MVDSIFVKGEGGSIIRMDLPLPEAIESRLMRGNLHRVDENGDPYTEERTRPAINALKSEWVGWAVFNGATPDAAEAATKQDLIEQYGVQDSEGEQGGDQPPADPDTTEQGGDQPPAE